MLYKMTTPPYFSLVYSDKNNQFSQCSGSHIIYFEIRGRRLLPKSESFQWGSTR